MNRYKCFQIFEMIYLLMIYLLMIVQRFVDRDMLMRYHWGLGVGHTYSHVSDHSEPNDESITPQVLHAQSLQADALDPVSSNIHVRMEPVNLDDEFLLDDRDGLGWESEDTGGDRLDNRSEADPTMYEMYGSDWGDEEHMD